MVVLNGSSVFHGRQQQEALLMYADCVSVTLLELHVNLIKRHLFLPLMT